MEMMKCPDEDCGKICQGKFCSDCGTKLIPISRLCCALLVDGSTCNEPIHTTQEFCSSCVARVEKLIKENCEIQAIRRLSVDKKKALGVTSELPVVDKKKEIENASEQLSLDEACTGSDCMEEKYLEDIASDCLDISDQEKSGSIFVASFPSGPNTGEDEVRELKRIAQGGVVKIKDYIESINNDWKRIPINIAVTGVSGSGKSTFINIIRGLRKGAEEYAEVGVTETTTCVKPYPHPKNPSLIFWDMPGVGTQSFQQDDKYLEFIDFKKYDFFLILSHKRFRQEDGWFAKKVTESGRSFCFIRTHVDADVSNDRKEDPTNHSKTNVITKIRQECKQELVRAGIDSEDVHTCIYLIDSYETNQYDFNKLTNTLITSNVLAEEKRKALLLSLPLITNDVIEEKRKELEKRIWKIALATAVVGSLPVPELGIHVDIKIIYSEFNEYRRQFGITDEYLKQLPQSDLAKSILIKYNNALQLIIDMLCSLGMSEVETDLLKIGIPIIGPVISASISYCVTNCTLKRLINTVVDDVKKLHQEMLH